MKPKEKNKETNLKDPNKPQEETLNEPKIINYSNSTPITSNKTTIARQINQNEIPLASNPNPNPLNHSKPKPKKKIQSNHIPFFSPIHSSQKTHTFPKSPLKIEPNSTFHEDLPRNQISFKKIKRNFSKMPSSILENSRIKLENNNSNNIDLQLIDNKVKDDQMNASFNFSEHSFKKNNNKGDISILNPINPDYNFFNTQTKMNNSFSLLDNEMINFSNKKNLFDPSLSFNYPQNKDELNDSLSHISVKNRSMSELPDLNKTFKDLETDSKLLIDINNQKEIGQGDESFDISRVNSNQFQNQRSSSLNPMSSMNFLKNESGQDFFNFPDKDFQNKNSFNEGIPKLNPNQFLNNSFQIYQQRKNSFNSKLSEDASYLLDDINKNDTINKGDGREDEVDKSFESNEKFLKMLDNDNKNQVNLNNTQERILEESNEDNSVSTNKIKENSLRMKIFKDNQCNISGKKQGALEFPPIKYVLDKYTNKLSSDFVELIKDKFEKNEPEIMSLFNKIVHNKDKWNKILNIINQEINKPDDNVTGNSEYPKSTITMTTQQKNEGNRMINNININISNHFTIDPASIFGGKIPKMLRKRTRQRKKAKKKKKIQPAKDDESYSGPDSEDMCKEKGIKRVKENMEDLRNNSFISENFNVQKIMDPDLHPNFIKNNNDEDIPKDKFFKILQNDNNKIQKFQTESNNEIESNEELLGKRSAKKKKRGRPKGSKNSIKGSQVGEYAFGRKTRRKKSTKNKSFNEQMKRVIDNGGFDDCNNYNGVYSEVTQTIFEILKSSFVYMQITKQKHIDFLNGSTEEAFVLRSILKKKFIVNDIFQKGELIMIKEKKRNEEINKFVVKRCMKFLMKKDKEKPDSKLFSDVNFDQSKGTQVIKTGQSVSSIKDANNLENNFLGLGEEFEIEKQSQNSFSLHPQSKKKKSTELFDMPINSQSNLFNNSVKREDSTKIVVHSKLLSENKFYRKFFLDTSFESGNPIEKYFLPNTKLANNSQNGKKYSFKTINVKYIKLILESTPYCLAMNDFLVNHFEPEYKKTRIEKLNLLATNINVKKYIKSVKLPWTVYEIEEAKKTFLDIVIKQKDINHKKFVAKQYELEKNIHSDQNKSDNIKRNQRNHKKEDINNFQACFVDPAENKLFSS